MFGLVTNLLPLNHRPAGDTGRTCPVCCTGVDPDDRYIAVRGMRVHGGCAGYRTRRLGAAAGSGRVSG